MLKRKINKMFATLLIILGTLLCFSGCNVNLHLGLTDYYYDNSEKYTVGGADISDKVENIEIDWIAGNVKVLPHNLDEVSFSEKSEKELNDDMRMRYWLDGTTLRIKFCASGRWNMNGLNKELTVSIPKNLILTELKVDSVSADIRLDTVGAKKLEFDTVSGNIDLTAAVEDSVEIDTVSGDTKAEFTKPLNEFKADTTSGDIDLTAAVKESVEIDTVSGDTKAKLIEPLNEFKGNTTSGEFRVTAQSISRFEFESMSGEVHLSAQKEIGDLEIDTTSGDIELNLPGNASFKLSYDTTSGDLNSDLPHTSKNDMYIFGDGKNEYNIDTVSGDVRITENR